MPGYTLMDGVGMNGGTSLLKVCPYGIDGDNSTIIVQNQSIFSAIFVDIRQVVLIVGLVVADSSCQDRARQLYLPAVVNAMLTATKIV